MSWEISSNTSSPNRWPWLSLISLEFVDVDEAQPGRLLGRVRLHPRQAALAQLFEALLEGLAVQHAGQGVALAVIQQARGDS
jgi:hypothetical protein